MKKNFRSIEITVKRLLNSFPTGGHVSLLKDSIIDVDVVREYQPGDKRLDSRSSLRTSSTMSRVFTPDKSLNIMLVLDVSSSQASKMEAAITTCLYMCYLADQMNDAVGLVTFGSQVGNFVFPGEDVRNVTSVLEQIYYRDKLDSQSDLESALQRVGSLELSNSLVIMVSDFCFPLSQKTTHLMRRITSGVNNVMLAAVLVNNQEWAFDFQPFRVDFRDSETNDVANWNFGSAAAMAKHLAAFHEWRSGLKNLLYQNKVEPVLMQIDRSDYMMPLVRFFLRA